MKRLLGIVLLCGGVVLVAHSQAGGSIYFAVIGGAMLGYFSGMCVR